MTALSDRDLLARLVAFDSTSRHGTSSIADFIADYIGRPGVRIEHNPSANPRKANLIATVGPETDDARRGLVLSGHMDVVPADEEEWESDPFELTEVDDTLVGRGAADMKGFLALAVNRAAAVDPARLRHPLTLLFTFDEELGTLGAKHFAETWPAPDRLPKQTIVGEPTALRVVRMHKGYLKLRLTFTGKAAHSGYPHLGVNAIEPAARAVAALADLRRTLERERPDRSEYFPEVPYPALNIGHIHGGVAINVVPDRCVVEFGVRLLPGMDRTAMIERMRTVLTDALPETAFRFEEIGDSPPMWHLAEDAPIYRLLCETMDQHATHSVSFATDAGWFSTLGFDCAVWGPGSIETAHRANEFIPVAELERAGAYLDTVIARTCLGEG